MKTIRRIIGKSLHLFYENITKFFPIHGRVLMLHWVGDEVQSNETEPYRITTAQCRKFIQWLKNKNTIHLNTWENECDFYALSIDDVPENFYQNAYPLLKEAKIPFTLFVNISLLDKEGFISKDQLIEMSKCEFCTIGSHGINHEEFTLLNNKQAQYDLRESKQKLEAIIGKSVELFAFPYGSYYACGYFNKHIAKKYYKYAFGTIAAPVTKPSLFNKYYLPRINVDSHFINKL